MAYAIKARIDDPQAASFAFTTVRTMYGGKHVAPGDVVFLFASENSGGKGLVARGVVTEVEAVARRPGVERQTPRVTLRVKRTALARGALGRAELRAFAGDAGRSPQGELHFKFYRQATDKLAGLTDAAAAYLAGSF